jgi:hypothetical protein
MNPRAVVATVLLGTAASMNSLHAQTPDPCSLYTCMAGMPGVVGLSGGPGCTASMQYWHTPAPAGLAVYHPPQGFNPPASAALRRTFMSTCPGSNAATNAAVLNLIITEYGYLP